MCRLFVRAHNTGLTVSNTEKNTGAVLGVREAADDQYSLIGRRPNPSSSKQESVLSKAPQAELEEMYFPLDGQDLPPAVVCTANSKAAMVKLTQQRSDRGSDKKPPGSHLHTSGSSLN